MTHGPMDDAGYPLLAWKFVPCEGSVHDGVYEVHGYAKRYEEVEDDEGHAVLTVSKRKRIKYRENLEEDKD